MFAQIRKYKVRGGGKAEDVSKKVEQTALSRIDQIPGFVDYYALKLKDGSFLSVSIYENQTGVEAGKKLSADWNKTDSGDLLPEQPDESFEGEILLHHSGKEKKAAA